MTIKYKIYVEGEGEVIFVSQLLRNIYSSDQTSFSEDKMNATLEYEEGSGIRILAMGGIDPKTLNLNFREIKREGELGIKTLMLIDADDSDPGHHPKGGYETRKKYMEMKVAEFNIPELPYFIIPGKNQEGNLEQLLEKAVSHKGKFTFRCVSNYIQCLTAIEEDFRPRLVTENCEKQDSKGNITFKPEKMNKEKMEYYIFTMLGKKTGNRSKLSSRDYLDTDVWDLGSEYLTELRNFLVANLPTP